MDRRERMNDPEETQRTIFDGLQAGLWTAIPGIIQSFNEDNMTVDVQPSIQGVYTNQQGAQTLVDMPLCLDCPVQFPCGGGYSLTFPIAEGDECLLIFASRCIDGWWQNGGISPPVELRMHDLSDGFALLGFRSVPRVLSNISLNSTQLRSDNYTGPTGTGECVDLSSGKLQLIADEVVVHGRNKATFDAGGTGFVYTPNLITTYTDGVPGEHNPPDPPEIPT